MSSRGFLTTSLGPRGKILAESKRYLPLLWPGFLSTADLEGAEETGVYLLERRLALARCWDALPFLASLFPEIPGFKAIGDSFLERLKAKRSRTIAMQVWELLPQEPDRFGMSLDAVVGAIEHRDAGFTLVVPARTGVNPFTRERMDWPEQSYRSLREALLPLCWLGERDLRPKKPEWIREVILGHVWP